MTEHQLARVVVAALIRNGDRVLLVCQQGPEDPAPAWALPGGVVQAGETAPEALAREVREETGLTVTDAGRLLYALHTAPAAGEPATVVLAFEAAGWSGEVREADPDGLVEAARFMPAAEAIRRAGESLPWRTMREPLLAHLRGEAGPGAVWLYRARPGGDAEFIARLGG